MNSSELVSIICISYNHESWIVETLESIKEQDYYYLEVFIVDNGSKDSTASKIREWVNQNSNLLSVHVQLLEESKPYCKLFNEVLATTKGRYVLDLSGDDVLFPDHISTSVNVLKQSPDTAFSFSDAYLIDSRNEVTTFYKRNSAGELKEEIELSNIYEILIRRSFICAATMVFDTEILKKEGGYDESLYYEDFEIQIRLTRKYPVIFSDHVGVLKRIHGGSMSSSQYQRYSSPMLPSTAKVCRKIEAMNIYPEENAALKQRIMYEMKHALWSANFEPARELADIGKRIGLKGLVFKFYSFWAKRSWDISWIYELLT
jgi:glycosyltransferase involved in cell wall biosynthesis